MGGPAKAAARLDYFLRELNGSNGATHTDHALLGNEPTLQRPLALRLDATSLHAPRQRCGARLRLYSTAPDGYPGNDDLGTLSSWYVFGALGLYPEVPGVGVLAIGSPLFGRASIALPHHRRATISATAYAFKRAAAQGQSTASRGRPAGSRSARRRRPTSAPCGSTAAPTGSPGPPTAPSPAAARISASSSVRTQTQLGSLCRGAAPVVRAAPADAEKHLHAVTLAPSRKGALWALAGLTALGTAVRFATLGLQSYHHDEVITVARVIPGSFTDMLHEVKHSESNPPLYYVLAWGWAKVFGTGETGAALALGAVRRRHDPVRLLRRA